MLLSTHCTSHSMTGSFKGRRNDEPKKTTIKSHYFWQMHTKTTFTIEREIKKTLFILTPLMYTFLEELCLLYKKFFMVGFFEWIEDISIYKVGQDSELYTAGHW